MKQVAPGVTGEPPVILGGLTPENVKRAILKTKAGRSRLSHRRLDGRKSREKVRKFLSEAHQAFELVKAK